MHTLQYCAVFWELVTPEARYCLTLLRTWWVGFGLVAASTQVLGLLELAAPSLYEELPVLHGPYHDVLQLAPPLRLLDGSSA